MDLSGMSLESRAGRGSYNPPTPSAIGPRTFLAIREARALSSYGWAQLFSLRLRLPFLLCLVSNLVILPSRNPSPVLLPRAVFLAIVVSSVFNIARQILILIRLLASAP